MRRAFTLVELALVVAILGITAAVAAPRYAASLVRYRLDAAANRIAADVEHVGAGARARSASQTVDFDTLTNTYTAAGLPSPDRRQVKYTVSLGEEPYRVVLISADFGGTATATFDGFGVPKAGGTVVIGATSLGRRITLDGVTGRASIAPVSIP